MTPLDVRIIRTLTADCRHDNERLERLAEFREWLQGARCPAVPATLALSVDACIAALVMRGGATVH
jgi:hypothetical protein